MLGYCACYWINMLAHVKNRFMYQRRVAAKKLNPQKWKKCFPQRNSPLARTYLNEMANETER